MTLRPSSIRPERRAPIAVLGVPFDNVTTAETLEIIAGIVASGQPRYAATANVDFIVQALEDVELRRILFDADLVLADGQPIVWASRWLGNPLPERVTGSGLVPLLLELAEERGWKVFFLGGTETSVAAAAEKTQAAHPGLRLVGAYSPPFKPLLEMDHGEIIRRVREAKPDILLVAFGCPKQEKWIRMNLEAAGVPFSVGVGATIDFLAGTFKRAPTWMQKTGTEWIFRMAQEPKRLAKRYGKDLPVFGIAILRQWWQMRGRSRPPAPSRAVEAPAPAPTGIEVLRMPGRLDAAAVADVQEPWLARVAAAPVVLDCSGMEMADSTGIGLLIRMRKQARQVGNGFALFGVGTRVDAALRLMKLEGFFPIAPDMEAARRCIDEGHAAAVAGMPGGANQDGLRWRGEVTAATVDQVRAGTLAAIADVGDGASVSVDLGAVEFVDSTGIGLMVALKKQLWQRRIRLTFKSPPEGVRSVLRMTRLETVLLDPVV